MKQLNMKYAIRIFIISLTLLLFGCGNVVHPSDEAVKQVAETCKTHNMVAYVYYTGSSATVECRKVQK